jgi:hypothetical protein
MGREGGFAGVGVFGFSVMLVAVVVVDAGCDTVLLARFSDEAEAESTKAGAMTRGEETEEEEEP